MSHEIRTPLNGVLIYRNLEGYASQRRTEKSMLIPSIVLARLLRVINDILDFSKIEAVLTELEPHVFALPKWLNETLFLYSANAEAKGLELITEIDPQIPPSFGRLQSSPAGPGQFDRQCHQVHRQRSH